MTAGNGGGFAWRLLCAVLATCVLPSLRRLVPAACVLLALAGLWPAAAQAQTVAYVGNVNQRATSTSPFITNPLARAQMFGTGSRSGGYQFQDVVLRLGNIGTGTLTVTIRESTTENLPSSNILYRLTNPASLVSGLNTFTAPPGATLQPRTFYFIVAQSSRGNAASWSRTRNLNDMDDGGADGWVITFPYLTERLNGTWSEEARNSAFMARIRGQTPPPPPTLVSNLENEDAGATTNVFSRRNVSQPFWTGSVAGGYTLDGIALRFDGSGAIDSGALTVTLRAEGEASRPGRLLHTLTNPSVVNPAGVNEFTAPEGIVLAADTQYHVVLENSSGNLQWSRALFGVDPGSEPDWRIPGRHFQQNDGGLWEFNSRAHVMAVRGSEAPLPTVSVTRVASTVTEGEDAQFTVTRTEVTAGELTVLYWVSATGDVVASGAEGAKTVAFADGDTEATVTVPTVQDSDDEAYGEVTLVLTNHAAYNLGFPRGAVVTVEDDDDVPLPTGQSALVGNLERFEGRFGETAFATQSLAQPFRTGSAARGYTLQGIALRLDREVDEVIDRRDVTVTLRESAADGRPGDLLYTLTTPSSVNAGVNEFTAPAGAFLAADTRYHVVLEYSTFFGFIRWALARTGEDSGAAAGWTISSSRYRQRGSGSWSSISLSAQAMAVRGIEAPLPTVSVERVASSVEEGEGAQFRVTRTVTTKGALTVAYSVSESRAMVAASDEGAKTVDFADGVTEVTVTVPTVDDSEDERNSTVTLRLTDDDAYDVGTRSATVTVRDDDEPPTLVSNLDNPLSSFHGHNAVILVSLTKTLSQSFRTGSAASGYALDGMALRFRELSFEQPGTLTATLRANDPDDKPGNVLHTLRNPSPVDYDGVNEFTTRSNVVLAANTRYHVVLDWNERIGGPQWLKAVDDSLDPGSADGWEIGNRHESSNRGQSWGGSRSSRLLIAVRGSEVPLPTVTVERVASPVEEGEDAQFTVTRAVTTTGALTVAYNVSEIGDMVASDEEGAQSVDFGGGATEVTVTVPTVEDTDHEADSTVTLTLTADAAYELGTDATAEVTVEDDDNAAPTGAPTIDDTTPIVGETLTADTSGIGDADGLTGVTYAYRWLRVASDGAETEVGTGESYTVVAADVGATLKVEVRYTDEDGTAETLESVVTAVANRPPRVTLVLTPDTITEGGTSTLTATLDRASSEDTVVTLQAAGSPVPLPVPLELTIRAGRTESQGDGLMLSPDDDDVDEPDRTLTFSGTAANSERITDPDPVTLTIRDNDDTPTVTLRLDPASISEDGEVSTVTASLDHPSSEATTVTVSVTAVAPATSSDYALSSNVELTIAAGATDSTGVVTITGVDNSAAAPDKEVTVSATATNSHGITDPDAVTLRIRNDDGVPALSIADASVDEGDSGSTTLDFTVTLDRAAAATVTVDWATSDGTATAGTDYTAGTGSLTFDAGDSSKTISVTVAGDDVDEPNETFTVTLAVQSGATIEDGTATGTITDDDATPTVTLRLDPASISENGDVSTVTAGLDHPSSQATTVTVTVTPVPPAVAGDYTLSTNRELTIAAGETGSTGVVTITPVNDQVDQPHKRVTVSATATNTLGITAPQDVTLTIRDDENAAPTGAPIINDTTPEAGDTLTADTSGIGDSDGLTGATFRYLWFRVRGGETQVGTGDSYTVLDADVGRRLKVVVKYIDDGGNTETVESALTGTVTEPSVPPKLTLHLDPASITEAGGTSTVTARLDRGVGREIVLRVQADAVSPATASDFTLSSNRTLRFPPGRTESTRRVTITAVDDAEDAPDKTVTVSAIHSRPHPGVSEPEPLTLTIEDDDDPPAGLSIRDASVDEGDATMRFTVTLSPAATGTVTVDWATADGTATAGADYTAGSGSLTFDDGDASKEVSVLVTGDNVDEPNETFTVTLSSAVGATIGDAKATGTIRDDDDAPTVTLHLDPASISENGGVSTVTASLDHPSSQGTTVWLSVTPVAPTVANDYTLSTNTILIFQPSETESTGLVTITAVDNAVDAPNKTVTVSSSLAVNILGANDPEPVTLTIRDDENVAPTGAPTIDDTTPVVGETLTADTSGIDDPDGLTGATFTWQWIRVSGGTETPIAGATTASYTVVAADLGATLKVKTTFTDDGGTTETLESAETGTVAAAAPPPPPPGDRVLVSNTSGDVLGTDSVTPAMAQPFTTGNASEGYDLSSVVVAINSPGSDVRVTIRESEADGSPGRIVHTLTNPPSDAGGGLHEYSAPAGATLEADTVYHVVAERISGAARRWKVTDSGREDPGAAPGWEIGASFWILDGGRWRSFPSSLQIQVKGTRVNVAPTGAPTIDDTTPVVGQTLTADPSGIADADGLTGATFTWQWIRVSGRTETPISGATTASYTVVAADVGATLKVAAGFTDDGGTAETVESAETAAVAAFPEVTVASDGDVTEGSAAVFTLTRTGDRAQALDVAYEVTVSGSFGVTTGAGTATFPARDATVQVSLATTGDTTHEAHGSVTVTLQADPAYDLGADAAATATVRDDDDSPATGAVAITGTPTEGATLTADTSGLADADGLDDAAWAWQWVRTPSGGSDADISGATSQTYVPVFADAGATLKVRVTLTDDEGHEATFTSAPTAAVAALPRPKVTLVLTPDTITEGGTSTVTATLDRASSADTLVTVSVAGSPLPVSLRIRAGQTESQELMFSPHDNDMDEPDRTLTFSGTAANSEGVTDPDPVTLTVRDDDDTPAVTLTLAPDSISEAGGVATVTATLDHPSSEETTVTVTATPESPAVAGDYTLSGSRLTIAAGGTASTGTVTITAVDNAVDAPNKRVTVSATATNTQGITPPQDVTLTVTDDENVPPTGAPAIDDTTPVVGETLTADTSGIGDSDGLTSPTYAYQWVRVASDGTQTPIAGATGATYTVAAADVGATLKVRVTFTDEGGAEETVESAVTAAAQAATLPTVSVERVASSVEEGEAAQFRVTRTGITAGALTVNYDVSESGDMVASGEEGAKTVAFADGESEKTVTVPTEEDTGHEADSTVTLTLTADAAYNLGSDATAEVAVEDDDNAAPTGAPTIDDTTPLVGEVLTADTSGIDDPDGLTNPRFTWQWIRTSGSTVTRISGATAATYAVVAADVDATLKVEVTFTDDGDITETLMSAATSAVKTSIVWVTSEGDVTEGSSAVWTLMRTGSATGMLSVKIGIRPSGGDFLVAEDGTTFPLDMTTEDETTFPAGSSTTQVSLSTVDDSTHEADGTVSLFVMESDDGSYSLGEPDEGQPEFAVLKIRDNDNAAPTGMVTIDDTTPVVGETLTADASGIDDPDGLTSPSFTWQWIRTSGGTATPISGATTASYTVVAADVGATLKVAASFTDDGGTDETVESAETATTRDDDDETPPTPMGNVLVSNVETSAGSFFSDPASSDQSLAQPFLTGSATGGYTLHRIGLRFNGTPEIGSGLTVTLRENAAGGSPGNVLHTLTNPDPVMRVGVNEFRAPAGVVLAADTRYHVVLEYSSDSGTPRWSRALPGLDSGSAAGWEIPRGYRQAGGASWASQLHSFVMAVRGTETASEPLPTVAVERVESPVEEGAGAQFRVTRTVTTAGALTVAYRVSESGAMVASGEEGAKTVAFADGDTEQTVTVPTVEDTVHEADSTVTLTLTADAAYELGTASAEVTVEDNDNAAPTGAPTIDDTTPVVGETLTADASGIDDPDGLTSPSFTWQWIRTSGGTATPISGATTASYTVVAADVGATLKVAATFTDDDGTQETVESAETATVEAVPALSIADASVDEGDSGSTTLDFTVTLDPVATKTVTVDWATSDGTATAGTDYTAGNGTLTFNSGDSSRTVSVTVAGDDVDEPNETFTVTLSGESGATIEDGAATGTITDDDDTPTVTLTLAPASISENGGVSTVTATLDHPSSEETTVTVTATPESPAVAGDYTLSGSRLTIAAGGTASTGTVTITAVDNAVDAPHKRVTVSATATNTQGITAPQDVTLAIRDDENVAPTGEPAIDDTMPVVGATLTVDPSGIGDSDGLAGVAYAYRWLRVAAGGAETEVGTGESYTVVAADVGATLKVEATFTDDGGAEETVESVVTATVVAAPPTLPEVSIMQGAGGSPITEGEDATFTLTLSKTVAALLLVNIRITETGDMMASNNLGNTVVAFAPNRKTANATYTTVEDDTDEPNSTVTVEVLEHESGNYMPGTPSMASVEVRDNDGPDGNAAPTGAPTIDDTTPVVGETLTADPSGIDDPDGLTSPTYTWQWIRVASDTTETRISGATAATYTVVAADVGATLKVEATFTDDGGTEETLESAETATVAAAPPTPPLPELSIGDASVDEGDSGVTTLDFTVTLDPAATETVTVDWATSDGTATAGTDYTAGNGTLTFNDGDFSKTVSVSVAGDDVDEPNETFEVTLTNPSGATLGDDTGTGTITDDDATPTVTLALAPDSISEAGGVATVTATLDHPSSEETTVTVTATPESPAVAGDYMLSGSELTIAAGGTASTGTVTITAVDNAVDAPHKTVTVSATATNTQGITQAQDVTLTIRDDENVAPTGAPAIDDTTPVVGETLTADPSGIGDSDGLTSPTYAYQWIRVASDGTQTPIAGATEETYTVATVDVGATLKVRVTFTDEGGTEETVESAVTAAAQAATLPTVSVAPVASPVEEGAGAQFRVTRTVVTTGALTVHYRVSESGAMVASGEEGAKSVAFGDGDTERTVTVPTEEDTGHEADSTVTLTLTADAAYNLGTATAEVAVEDDDDSPTTGTVTVAGTPAEGETLTADTSGLTDADGLANAGYVYQWVRTPAGGSDADISGATSQTYVPVFADAGATLEVKVTVTDDEGHEASFTSAPTAAVAAAPRPSVTVVSDGDVTEGSAALFTLTRTGDTAGTLDVDYEVTATGNFGVTTGASTATFPANSATVQVSVPTTGDSTHEAHGSVTLTLTADTGSDPAYLLGDPSTATAAVEDDDDSPATGTVTVTGTPAEGETLTADTSGLTDADGLDNAGYAYQWVRTPAGGSDADISGATSQTYVPVFADVGATLKVEVEVTDDEGHEASFTSAPTAAVAAAPRPSVTVVSDGDVTEGSPALFTLARTGATAGTLEVAYEVTATGSFGVTTGASTATFPANSATVQVSVATTGDSTHEAHGSVTLTLTADTGTDPAYLLGDPATATAAVEDDDNAAPTGAPTIDDTTPVVGETLTADPSGIADPDGLTGAAFTWQWVRVSGGTDTPIAGATTASYTVADADVGATLKVEASFTDDGGTAETLESAETATVAAAPRPLVAVEPVASPVDEGEDAQFRVTRTVVTTGALTVRYDVSESGAMVASGEEGAKSVAFADGDTEQTVTVPTEEDTGHEADSVVTLTLTADAAYDLGTASAEVTVTDDDNAAPTGAPTIDDTTPVVGETLTADPSGIADPDGLTGATFTWQWVRVSGGTDTPIAGATTASYVVVAGDVGATLKVAASYTDDGGTAETLESAETATVEAAVLPEVTVVSDGDVTEGSAAVFTLTRTGATAGTLDVAYEVTATGDFGVTTGAGTASFPANSATVQVSVATTGDSTHEAHGSVTLTLTADTSTDPAYLLGDPSTATAAVEDDDNAAPTGAPTIDDTTPVVGETLTADPSGIADPDGLTGATFTWQWVRVSGGTDTPIAGATTASYTVADADVGATLKVEASFTDDGGTAETLESAETATVALPMLSIADASVDEGDTGSATMTFTVTLDPMAPETVTVDWATADETASAGTDYTAANGTLTFNAGETEKTVTVTVAGDRVDEANETFTVTLSNASSGATIGDGTATGTITDDDAMPAVTLLLSPDTIDEDGGTATVTARLDRPSVEDTTVTVAVAPESPATAGDYTLSVNRELTIAAGETTSTGEVTVTAVDNDRSEGSKEVTVSGTAENPQGVTAPEAVTLAIVDDEAPPPEVSIGDTSVEEGDAGESTTLEFPVTLDPAAAVEVRVDWATEDGTASAGTDYTAANGTLTFNAGETEKTVTVTVAGDDVDEADETFTVTLSGASGATLGRATATGTIRDDGEAPALRLVLTPASIGEKGGVSTVTARLDRPSSEETTVRVSVSPVSPAVAGDYRLSANRELRVAAGATTSTGRVTVRAVDNAVDAPDKQVRVWGTAENSLGVTAPEAVRLRIVDDDEPVLSIGDASVDEGDAGESTTLEFTVRLSPVSSRRVRVEWSSAGGTAAAGTDYTAGKGSLTFGAGETRKTVSVSVRGDEVDEPDETLTVTLSNAVGATLVKAVGTGTITDDDEAPAVRLVLTPDSVGEDGGVSTVTARLDHPSSEETTLRVSVAPVTPAEAGDYRLSANRELAVAAGETESTGEVTISAVDNAVDAPDKEVAVSGTAENSLGVTAPEAVRLTIEDDEEPMLSVDDASVEEGDTGDRTTLDFTVTLDLAAAGEVRVDWASADGTAAAGADYTAGKGSLTFGAGETRRTVSVSVTGDDMDEPDETFTVTLSDAVGALIEDGTGTGTIVDDDEAPAVTLVLAPYSIEEDGGVSTVTARLDHPSSEETTLRVSVTPVSPAVAGDYTLSANRELRVAAGATTSTGRVTIAAVDDDVGSLDKEVRVSATATNALGVTAPEAVRLTIEDDDLIAGRQRRLEHALATFGRTVAQDLVGAVEDRSWSAAAGTTATLGGTPLASFRPDEAVYGALQRHVGPDGDWEGGAALRELLSRSSFQLSLGDEGAGDSGALMLWGRGSQGWSAGRLDPAVETRGEVLSGQLGLELRPREDVLLGVMLSGSTGELDFDGALETEVETELAGVHPYAQWWPRQGLRTWAMLGYGLGEATLTDTFSTLTETDIETDIAMMMAAAGGSKEVASRWGIDWSLGTNGFFAQFDAEERAELLPALKSEAWQMRLLLEGRAGKAIDEVSRLSGNVELAARVDGGDAETGVGMELGGRVAYGHSNLGIDVTASGRVLLSHAEGLEDAGMSLALGVDPGEPGRGLYFALAPLWGNATSGARAMWEDRQASTGLPHGSDGRLFDPKARLDSELGYTALLPSRRGTLTSYAAFSSDGGAARQYRIGRRLELADTLSMSLEAERRESASAAHEHSIWLISNIRF